MKKILLFITILLSFVNFTNAQDIILTKNSDVISAKILEITSTEVKYKKFSNQDGPTFTLLKSEVSSVTYQNGEKEVFDVKPANKSANVRVSPYTFCGCEIMMYDMPKELEFEQAVGSAPEGWRLPTRNELQCMCEHQREIGSFRFSEYWTSERESNSRAYTRTFDDCQEEKAKTKHDHGVRYVRDLY
ncbi:MAG: hypothetical protein LBN95_14110 [Prevotellaceae bacterium]|jgi:hypothetical protein|nr:hypothetical protein [Prevotellaceae bacterium]